MKAIVSAGMIFLMLGGAALGQETKTVTKKGPNGKSIKVKMDGKYSTCVRDGQRMGYSASAAASYCRSRGLR
jgi:hypothetical protein